VIGRLLERVTELTYPKSKLQTIVIDDASTDRTGEIADEYGRKYPYIEVLHRRVGIGGKGKAAACNEGFQKSRGDIILCFDADYYPTRDIVEKLAGHFSDAKVGAVQGRVVVLNEPENIVTRLVALERIGGYRVDQQARDSLDLIAQYGGTVGGVRSSLLKSLNGWDESMLAEDTDLTLNVYLAGYKVRYDVDAECYEEAVDSWKAYRRQRTRWAKGHMQCFFKHWRSVLTSKNLSLKEKVDALMLLNVYFMPIVALLSMFTGVLLIFLGFTLFSYLWLFIPICLYSFVGNFAPFFEIGVGLYLDDRERTQWLIPLLIFTLFYNIPICFKAFFSLVASKILRKNAHTWVKTPHSGNGDGCIQNLNTRARQGQR
jgi:cellulose synthase/poly-beta-1,6-N-acetylglucosamine synthase-like glycosyltransferase